MSKLIKFFLVLLISTLSFGQSVKIDVEDYFQADENFEFIFEIKNHDYKKIIVDCQGFINNIGIELENGYKDILVLDIGECEDIHSKIVVSLQENDDACLMIDFDKRWYDVKSSCRALR